MLKNGFIRKVKLILKFMTLHTTWETNYYNTLQMDSNREPLSS